MSAEKVECLVVVIRGTVSRQNFTIPAGTVLRRVREFSSSYRGLWDSAEGNFYVTVPRGDCGRFETLPAQAGS